MGGACARATRPQPAGTPLHTLTERLRREGGSDVASNFIPYTAKARVRYGGFGTASTRHATHITHKNTIERFTKRLR